MLSGQSAGGGFWLESDDRKPLVARVSGYHSANEWGSRYWNGEVAVELHPTPGAVDRPGPRDLPGGHRGPVGDRRAGRSAARRSSGGHYVFAGFDQTELALAARLSWIFSPRLSLQVYTQPLVSRGSYAGFKELERPAQLRLPRPTARTRSPTTRSPTPTPPTPGGAPGPSPSRTPTSTSSRSG